MDKRTFLSPDRVAELLEMCLEPPSSGTGGASTCRESVAMGSPVSAVVNNLHMEFFEELAQESPLIRPRLWKWYVDDTYCIMKKSTVDELLHHLNSVRPTINFTVELERDATLPFLDTILQRKQASSLNVTVYMKPVHTDRYMHFNSHHPSHVKKGLVRCFYDRARNIITQEDLQIEEDHSTGVLRQNGCPAMLVCTSSFPFPLTTNATQEKESQDISKPPLVMIAYVASVSEDTRRVCRKFDMKVIFKSGWTLRLLLTKPKDTLPLRKQSNVHVMYQIPCSSGKVYISETKSRLDTRIKEN